MTAIKIKAKKKKGSWYEKYLPFIARGRERQIDWLIGKFKKKILSYEEITPYVKLLLEEDDPEGEQHLRELLSDLPDGVLGEMLRAADIYDTPKLLQLMPRITVDHAAIAMCKTPPPYERSPVMVIDRIFQIIHEVSGDLLRKGAARLRERKEIPAHFEESISRFEEVLKDQEFLSTLYPKARN